MLLSWSFQAACDIFEAAVPLLYSLRNYDKK